MRVNDLLSPLAPGTFADERCVLMGTGRAEATVSEANELAFGTDHLPLFT